MLGLLGWERFQDMSEGHPSITAPLHPIPSHCHTFSCLSPALNAPMCRFTSLLPGTLHGVLGGGASSSPPCTPRNVPGGGPLASDQHSDSSAAGLAVMVTDTLHGTFEIVHASGEPACI